MLAVVYTDIDGVDGYDESVDVLISKLLDTNDDGVPSVGDTVVNNQYPLDFGPTQYGNLQVATQNVTAIVFTDPGAVIVAVDWDGTGLAKVAIWDARPEFSYEAYGQIDYDLSGEPQMLVHDDHGGSSYADVDGIEVGLDAPNAPDTAVNMSQDDPADRSFLDVRINLTP